MSAILVSNIKETHMRIRSEAVTINGNTNHYLAMMFSNEEFKALGLTRHANRVDVRVKAGRILISASKDPMARNSYSVYRSSSKTWRVSISNNVLGLQQKKSEAKFPKFCVRQGTTGFSKGEIF